MKEVLQIEWCTNQYQFLKETNILIVTFHIFVQTSLYFRAMKPDYWAAAKNHAFLLQLQLKF